MKVVKLQWITLLHNKAYHYVLEISTPQMILIIKYSNEQYCS